MDDQRVYQVGISGSYGGMNLGDEAILETIVAQLRSRLKVEITVFSKNPEETLKRHGVEHAVPVRRLAREEVRARIEGPDVFVLGALAGYLGVKPRRVPAGEVQCELRRQGADLG